MVNPCAEAIANILRRKRQERMEMLRKYDAACLKRDDDGKYGTPPKGLSSEIEMLRREIVTLEEAQKVALNG